MDILSQWLSVEAKLISCPFTKYVKVIFHDVNQIINHFPKQGEYSKPIIPPLREITNVFNCACCGITCTGVISI